MRGQADTADATEQTGNFDPLPEASYNVTITEVAEKTTKGGDPMAAVTFEVMDGEYEGRKLFDNIVIPKAGSPAFKIMGRTMHFLRMIGQSYEGKFTYDTEKWLHERLRVKVGIKTQEQGKRAGQKVNEITAHELYGTNAEAEDDPFK